MIAEPMDEMTPLAPSSEAAIESELTVEPLEATPEETVEGEVAESEIVESEIALCRQCEAIAAQSCRRCKIDLCDNCSYHEVDSTKYYCRACADAIVGVCDICEALHARPCRTCGTKVCEAHHKRVIARWGWGGAIGQGGVVDWFPILHTYCQDHGQNLLDILKPAIKTMKGYDGSSPEW